MKVLVRLLLLLTVILLCHCARIDHNGVNNFAASTAAAHFSLLRQRAPNQQGNQYDVQNHRHDNGAIQLIILLGCLTHARFPHSMSAIYC